MVDTPRPTCSHIRETPIPRTPSKIQSGMTLPTRPSALITNPISTLSITTIAVTLPIHRHVRLRARSFSTAPRRCTCFALEKDSQYLLWPAMARDRRSGSSDASRISPFARPSTSSEGTSRPVFLSSTISGMPSTACTPSTECGQSSLIA